MEMYQQSKAHSQLNPWQANERTPVFVPVLLTQAPTTSGNFHFHGYAEQMMPPFVQPLCTDSAVPECKHAPHVVACAPGSWCVGGGMKSPSAERSRASSWSMEECHSLNARLDSVDMNGLEKQFSDGDEESLKAALDIILSDVWYFANHRIGCHVVQLAFDKVDKKGKECLAMGMKGNILKATKSRHANHVLQKMIATLPLSQLRFVVEELLHVADQIARHTYGCRVVKRLVEHSTTCDTSVIALIHQILATPADVRSLAVHHNGNYVLRTILEHGLLEYRTDIARAMQSELFRFAKQKYASHVVQAAFVHCDAQTCMGLASELLQDPRLDELESNLYGRHVVQELKRFSCDCSEGAFDVIGGA
jgi:hypothetical protein